MNNQEIEQGAALQIEKWIKENNIVFAGRTMRITIELVPAQVCVVTLVNSSSGISALTEDEKKLNNFFQYVPRRLVNILIRKLGISTFSNLQQLTMKDIASRKYIGPKGLVILLEALTKIGEGQSRLAQEVTIFLSKPKRLTPCEEAKQSVVKKLTSSDWDKMRNAVMRSRGYLTEKHLKILKRLQDSNNNSIVINKDEFCWQPSSTISSMNMWLKKDGTPYRLKHTGVNKDGIHTISVVMGYYVPIAQPVEVQ